MPIRTLSALLMMLLPLCASGCGTRHIYQRPGTGTILRKALTNVEVDAPDENGKLVPGKADVPAGAIIVVPSENIREVPSLKASSPDVF